MRVEQLGVPSLLLGAVSGAGYRASTSTLAPGDGLVLLTDGVTEARAPRSLEPASPRDTDGADDADADADAAIVLFGASRLRATLTATADPVGAAPDRGTASRLAAAVRGAVETFADGALRDDLALLVLHAPAPASTTTASR